MSIDYYIKNERRDFSIQALDEKNLPDTPEHIFAEWFREAMEKKITDANAMVLSTVGKNMQPTSRVVLMRNFTEHGIMFYTNYLSNKAKQMEENPNVCLNFFWPQIDKQVRIEGVVEKISEQESMEYFNTRPTESKLGAWASEQSVFIESRLALEYKLTEVEKRFKDMPIPKPKHWGGYVVKIKLFEFWLGRPARLHDRIIFEKNSQTNTWKKYRLQP